MPRIKIKIDMVIQAQVLLSEPDKVENGRSRHYRDPSFCCQYNNLEVELGDVSKHKAIFHRLP